MLLTPVSTHWHQNSSLSTANSSNSSFSKLKIHYIFQFEDSIYHNEIHDSASLPRSNSLGRRTPTTRCHNRERLQCCFFIESTVRPQIPPLHQLLKICLLPFLPASTSPQTQPAAQISPTSPHPRNRSSAKSSQRSQ